MPVYQNILLAVMQPRISPFLPIGDDDNLLLMESVSNSVRSMYDRRPTFGRNWLYYDNGFLRRIMLRRSQKPRTHESCCSQLGSLI